MTSWHRLFGLFLTDFFTGSPYTVELEKDLSIKQQFLDVVIVRKDQEGTVAELPDGFDNLNEYNLLSYKSFHEAIDGWALKELVGHYVNYRKQVSPSMDELLPETQFQLYAVSTRYPHKLSRQVPLRCLGEGVYELDWATDTIRLIVLSKIPEGQHNAVLRLFSHQRDAVLQARSQYRIRQTDMSRVIQQLYEYYKLENIDMAYTLQDFNKDYVLDHLNLLSPDEVLKRYSPDEVLKRYSPDDIADHLPPAELKILLEKIEKKVRQNNGGGVR